MNKTATFFALISLFLVGCHGAQYHFKQGNKYAEAAMLKRAVTEYKMALDRKPDKLKYVLAMNTEGNALLSELYGKTQLSESDSSFVYNFLEAEQWRTYLGKYLDNAEMYKSSILTEEFERNKGAYIRRSIELAEEWNRLEAFDRSQTKLKELLKLDPNNAKVKELLEFAEVEPVYKEGLKAFENRDYRTAYGILSPTIHKYPHQNLLVDLRDEALERGSYRLGFTQVDARQRTTMLANSIRSGMISQIARYKDPFIILLDRSNIGLLKDEQNAILDGRTSSGNGIEQELLAADAYVTIDVVAFSENEGELIREEKRGWEEYTYKIKDAEGNDVNKTEYKKVTYDEYFKENSVQYEVNITLVERATSRILESYTEAFSEQSKVNYISFSGKGALYPGYWKYKLIDNRSDYRSTSIVERNRLANLQRASRRIKSTDEMRGNASVQFSRQFAEFIYNLKLTNK